MSAELDELETMFFGEYKTVSPPRSHKQLLARREFMDRGRERSRITAGRMGGHRKYKVISVAPVNLPPVADDPD